ncbi:hypothetical protein NDR89_23300 [Cupriavidus gilardii]|uniref:Uncharacterized protein n=1 Tax=Cupriavidus gilardii TaxID=82541 RepID=A0ABY4VUK8_9BURK|nr:hypothetical protein [Cupriavidus gilardii]USE79521.1 hypothetical protein NDR89_23300 [Cupriavidus gilardii]
MKRINDGGPVFPATWTNDGDMISTTPNGMVIAPGETVELQGMTLRDYFAAKAMQGMLADLPKSLWGLQWEASTAACAYRLADEMLAAREGKA